MYKKELSDKFFIEKRHNLNQTLYDVDCSLEKVKTFMRVVTQSDKLYFKNLLLGRIGNEVNKTSALYTFPTTDFFDLIFALQIYLCSYDVHELYAGMGLFSNMYENYVGYKYTNYCFPKTSLYASDCLLCNETMSSYKYFPISTTSSVKYILSKTNLQNSICVMILPTDIGSIINSFLKECKPLCVILVVTNNMVEKIGNILPGFNILKLQSNIVSFLDYFMGDSYISNTCTLIISKHNITINLINTILSELIHTKTTIKPYVNNLMDIEILFNNLIINKKLPQSLMDMDSENKMLTLEHIYDLTNTNSEKVINDFYKFIRDNVTIDKNDDYREFKKYIMWEPIPPMYCSKAKFLEYKKLYDMLTLQLDGLNILIDEGILPNWIKTKKEAKIYLYLEYDTDKKHWKMDRDSFIDYITSKFDITNNE